MKADSLDAVATILVMVVLSPFILLDSYIKLTSETLRDPTLVAVIICSPMIIIEIIPLAFYSFAFNKDNNLEDVESLFMFIVVYLLLPFTICLSLARVSVILFFNLFVEEPSEKIIINIISSLILVALLPFLVLVFVFHSLGYLRKKASTSEI